MLTKFLITHNNYDAILANPARLAEHNITKIYLRNRNLPIETFRAFLELKNVEIFVNYNDSLSDSTQRAIFALFDGYLLIYSFVFSVVWGVRKILGKDSPKHTANL